MKVFEIAGPVFTKQVEEAPEEKINDDDWTRIEQGGLTSGEDIVLSKNGDRAVQALQLTDQDLELLKAVALGWADMSDLGDLEQDIYNYLVDNNPGAIHGGDDDPSDEIMDELESWFEDAVHEDKNPFKKFPQSTKPIEMPSHNEISDEEIARKLDGKGIPSMPSHNEISDEEIARILKLAGR